MVGQPLRAAIALNSETAAAIVAFSSAPADKEALASSVVIFVIPCSLVGPTIGPSLGPWLGPSFS